MNTTSQHSEDASRSCAPVSGSASKWREACKALAADIECPNDVEGWLVSIRDVEDGYPQYIRDRGYGMSPMEGLGSMTDDIDNLRRYLGAAIAMLTSYAPATHPGTAQLVQESQALLDATVSRKRNTKT